MLGLSASLRAQGPAARHRIGILYGYARTDAGYFVGLLRAELDKLGWTDGRKIALLEPRSAEGRNDRLPSLAAELVGLTLGYQVNTNLALTFGYKSTINDKGPGDLRMDAFMVSLVFGWHQMIEGMRRLKSGEY